MNQNSGILAPWLLYKEVDVHPSQYDIYQYLSHFSPLFIPCPVCRGSVKNRPTATARFGPAGVASLEVGRNSWLRARQDVLHTCSANVNQKFQMFSKSIIKNPKKKVPGMWVCTLLLQKEITLLRISSNDHHLTHYSDIVSDITSGSMYGIYILTVYLTLFPGITYSDFLSAILSDIYPDILSHLYLPFYLSGILSNIVSPWVRVTPQHPELPPRLSHAAGLYGPIGCQKSTQGMHDAHHQQSWRHLSVISGEIGSSLMISKQ